MSGPSAAGPSEALHAVSRVLTAALDLQGPTSVEQALVDEARDLFAVAAAALVRVSRAESVLRLSACAPGPARLDRELAFAVHPGVRELVERRRSSLRLGEVEAGTVLRALGLDGAEPGGAIVLPLRSREAVDHLLVLSCRPRATHGAGDLEVAEAFARAAGTALAHLRLAEEQTTQAARQSALVDAAQRLNDGGLELPAVLQSICTQAVSILDADSAVVYRRQGEELRIEAATGLAPEILGYALPPGGGIAGQVLATGRAMLTNDYRRVTRPEPGSPFAHMRSALAVPLRWEGELRGVLSVGFTRPRFLDAQDLALLQAFGELAAAACRNAAVASQLARAARTDGLTGCLNHAALQEALAREVDRADRSGRPLSVVLLDLDDFKAVNERGGHLAGDAVLREVGHALRDATRPYDLVARYGGDEFAIIASDTDEATAVQVAARALERVGDALSDLDLTRGAGASAGVAEHEPGGSATRLLDAADHALMHGKHELGPGSCVAASELPDERRRAARDRPAAPPSALPAAGWAARPDAEAARMRRRTRQLALATALGARLAAMTDARAIADAVVDELHASFGFHLSTVLRLREDGRVHAFAVRGSQAARAHASSWSGHGDAGLVGRALRERRVVRCDDVRLDAAYVDPGIETLSELVVPIMAGDVLWGVVNVEELHTGAFDGDDEQLLRTIADQAGAALRCAALFTRLEDAYLQTAEALASALEAQPPDAGARRSLAAAAEAVGRRLGLAGTALSDLRYGAVLHDIGEVAVPRAVLDKPGVLARDERDLVERHPEVGAEILAPVDFLQGVLPIVRHGHERWDGGGYPAGLQGEEIPLGARIVLVCEAYEAMRSPRPHRPALGAPEARAELERHAGSQFDPQVVEAYLDVLAEPDGALAYSA